MPRVESQILTAAASARAFQALLQLFGATALEPRTLLAWAAVHGLSTLLTEDTITGRFGSAAELEAAIGATLQRPAQVL